MATFTLPAMQVVPNAQVDFPGLAVGDTTLAVRVSQGWNQVAGYITLVTADATGGNLQVQQSMNGTNWTYVNKFPVTSAIPTVAFNVTILARYIRLVFTNSAAVPLTIQMHGLLKTD